mmetsp:Transcript_16808/g.31843  ORF Transcript_16808/g.31843 Transcript_16808/m.31843 type:complete len:107 (+) Transcript_16808:303-623(+)
MCVEQLSNGGQKCDNCVGKAGNLVSTEHMKTRDVYKEQDDEEGRTKGKLELEDTQDSKNDNDDDEVTTEHHEDEWTAAWMKTGNNKTDWMNKSSVKKDDKHMHGHD